MSGVSIGLAKQINESEAQLKIYATFSSVVLKRCEARLQLLEL